jgi:hypothetical protein
MFVRQGNGLQAMPNYAAEGILLEVSTKEGTCKVTLEATSAMGASRKDVSVLAIDSPKVSNKTCLVQLRERWQIEQVIVGVRGQNALK